MQRLTNDYLVAMCKEVTESYDSACRAFFGRPNKEAIARKVALLQIVSRLHRYTPSEAYITLYQFYRSHAFDSRLIALLRDRLAMIVGVAIPRLVINRRGGNALAFANAVLLFQKRADGIKKEIGMDSDRDVILHSMNAYSG